MDVALKLNQAELGAQVLSAQAPGLGELFFVSDIALSSRRLPRGGVPVLFPQFADRGSLIKHGFARYSMWQSSSVDTCCRTIKRLDVAPDDFKDWPYKASIVLETYLSEGAFEQSLTVINTGDEAFSWCGGLHPYILVNDLEKSSLSGLAGVPYKDRYSEVAGLIGENSLEWDGAPCEKLFRAAPPLILSSGCKRLKISTTGFDQWMVWNPGKDGASKLPDMDDGDWRHFVCIEPVCVDKQVTLPACSDFSGSLKFEWNI